ncbi:MAG TPA: maltose alpha-D-glucosyltransferase [Thermoanaerobaculia bacterium]|nr:maltose alpha-D-glucosyltransferase [Thermoanaerobaculia bacterium]
MSIDVNDRARPLAAARRASEARADDPLWYKDALIYEVHVRAFADSDGDGVGDFRGLTGKLDYLRDLGVTAIWVLPFYPSPWRDDGYDISDYTSVHPAYGTLDDFKLFLDEAHRRGLKVITELVVNHTSDRHPWFERARRAPPGTRERNFYVWSDTPDRYADARIIFTDTETSNWTWDAVARAYYWHRFFSHQPDLNFDNEEVHEALLAALDFWMELGVDGMRLDAVPYLYEREGTNCENLPETHAFLRKLRAHVDARFAGRMLLAEANQWPEDSIPYFGDPEHGAPECHMAFHFPVMPRLYMAIRMEDRYPVVDILEQTPPIPPGCQWATFLRNHDELTLEMVTDEDRDYMYRVYAQDVQARINVGIRRRLGPLLGKDRRRIELMNSLLFSLPGTPVLYYGDEIGMGDNIYIGDRNGVRTPMQWSGDRNAGFSTANPQRLYLPVITDPEYHYQAINVETQQGNPHSLLWWTRRLIALRKRYRAFGRGSLELLRPGNHHVLAFVRRWQVETMLVVANLSRFVQPVELDLREFAGLTPVELFGGTQFPLISAERPYPLTIGQHAFYWFSLQREPARRPGLREAGVAAGKNARGETGEDEVPVIALQGSWESCFAGPSRAAFEAALAARLPEYRWFGGKARTLRTASVTEAVPLEAAAGASGAVLLLVEVTYTQGEAELYSLPLAFSPAAQPVAGDLPGAGATAAAPAPAASGTPAGPAAEGAAASAAAPASTAATAATAPIAPAAPPAPSPVSPAGALPAPPPASVWARLESDLPEGTGTLFDPLPDPEFGRRLLAALAAGRRFRGPLHEVIGWTSPAFAALRGPQPLAELEAGLLGVEQSNSSLRYGDRLVLKLFRKLEPGENPDLEVGLFLTEATTFRHMPQVAGAFEIRRRREPGEPHGVRASAQGMMTLGVLQGFVPNEGDAWQFTLDALGRYFERARTGWGRGEPGRAALPAGSVLELAAVAGGAAAPAELYERLGTYLPTVRLLGARTAELHLALGSAPADNPAFAPEPFSTLHQRSLYQSMRSLTGRIFGLLRQRLAALPAAAQAGAEQLLAAEAQVIGRFGLLLGEKVGATRIRTHGDYHLGQVLYTGKDFVILDFEGEPARPLSERRLKRSPLRDVASMLRSFQYAAHARLIEESAIGTVTPQELPELESWALYWERWASAAFLGAYLERAGPASFVPAAPSELALLLDAYTLEKAIYELGYELNNRPGWVSIPLAGIRQILGLARPAAADAADEGSPPPPPPAPPQPPAGRGR